MKGRFCIYLCASLLAAGALAGCAAQTAALITGIQRPAIRADEVRIFTKAPDSFEEIAVIEAVAGKGTRDAQGQMDSAVEGLKAKAASLGANGVILTAVDDKHTGYYYNAAVYAKRLKGIAIYVKN